MRWLCTLLGVLIFSLAAYGQDAPDLFAGTVLYPDGQPAVGAQVWLTTEDWVEYEGPRLLAQTETDTQGRFEFRDLPPVPEQPGSYTICVLKQGYAFAWAGRIRPPDAALRMVLEREVPLRGRVLDPQGNPAAGVQPRLSFPVRSPGFDPLEIFGYGSVYAPPAELSQMMITATDERGEFEIHHLPAGVEMTLRVEEENYARKAVRHHWAELMSGEPVEINLEEPGTVRGRVYRAEDGAPVAGVEVATYAGGKATTDQQGRYEITNLRSGAYQIYLHELPTEFTAAAVADITVEPGATVEGVDLKVIPGYEIRGLVTEQDTGEPIADFGVCCNTAQQPLVGKAWPLVRTGPDGRYSLRAPEGRAELRRFYVPKGWRPAKTIDWDTERFTVTAEEAPYEVNFEAVRARPISGTVLAPDGQPAAYARLLLYSDKGDYVFISTVTADDEGRFCFESVRPDATCVLNAYLGEHMTVVDTVVGPEEESPVILHLTAKVRPTLTGRIVGEDGRPVPYAIIRVDSRRYSLDHGIRSLSWAVRGNAIADVEGRFTLRALWSGMHPKLRVRAGGYAEQERELEPLTLGEQRNLGDLVMPIAGVVISGVVVDEKGEIVPGAPVGVRSRQGRFSRSIWAATDVQGRFRFAQLPRERLIIRASQFQFDSIPAEVGPESEEVVIRVIRRSDQILYTHRFHPPLQGEGEGMKATLYALHRFQAFSPTGEVEQYLGLDLEVERSPDLQVRLQVSLVDDQGRSLERVSAVFRREGWPPPAFVLPKADVTALAQVRLVDRPLRVGDPVEIGPLGLQMPGGPPQPPFLLWSLALTEEPLTTAEQPLDRGAPPYLMARVYAVSSPGLRWDITSASSGPEGPELIPVTSFEYSPAYQEITLPDSLRQWEAALQQEAQLALERLEVFGARVPDDPVVQGFWLESPGGHGAIVLPEFLNLTAVWHTVPAWSVVISEDIPLPPELTQAIEF